MVFAGLLGDIARKTMTKAAPKLQAAVPPAEPPAAPPAEATGASEAEPDTAAAPKA